MRKTPWLFAILLACGASSAQAAVKPHGLFQDNMVLQQGAKVAVWGKADPGEKVTVTLEGQQANATADDKGRWTAYLANLKAGGPHELTIAGTNTIKLKNVLVGEVWVGSGQSNMEWTVNQCGGNELKAAKAAPTNAKLRLFTVKRNPQEMPVDDVTGEWKEAGPDSAPPFSAVSYFFGQELQSNLQVPVGMISTSWGGTRAEAWTSRDALRRLGKDYDAMVEGHEAAFKKNPQAAQNPNAPSVLYNGMIHPILPYTVKGAIWYQGESNVGQAYNYQRLFPGMIQNWREAWNNAGMPFFFVQLAPFLAVTKDAGDSAWAELREAQRQTAHKVQNTGMAVITDLGHEADIHPTPKKPVGERLAWIAIEDTYKKPGGDSRKSPDVEAVKFEGGKAVVTLTTKALVSKEFETSDERIDGKTKKSRGFAWRAKEGSTGAPVQGFSIAGKDGKFHNAQAKIDGNRVIVWSDQVSEPAAVRYGWSNHPICSLFSATGVPVTPFRTDDFRFTTQPK